MKIQYISYINSPEADPAQHHAVTTTNPNADTTPAPQNMTDFPMSKWRQDRENEFMDNNTTLFDSVNAVRKTKGTRAQDEYKKELHEVKLERQKAWIDHLSDKVCAALEAKIVALEAVSSSLATDTMYVAALPEFFWRDIDDHHSSDKADDNYGMAFYNQAMNYFLEGGRLAQLTTDYPNLIIFAGTMWWKILDSEEKTKNEGYNNSLCIFHSGILAHTWSKQWTSSIDGAGSKKLKPISLNTAGPDRPFIGFKGVDFGMDICLDLMVGPDETKATGPVSKYILAKQNIMPKVQMLISGGMPIIGNGNYIYASHLLLRCDALSDTQGNYADIVSSPFIPMTAVVSASAPAAPVAPAVDECFYVFAPVDIN